MCLTVTYANNGSYKKDCIQIEIFYYNVSKSGMDPEGYCGMAVPTFGLDHTLGVPGVFSKS